MKIDVLVIGFGSIGKRHAANLHSLGYTPYVLTKYPDPRLPYHFIFSITEIEIAKHVVICSPTARHLEDFSEIVIKLHPKRVLIEKPIEYSLERAKRILTLAKANNIEVLVAYNLRFLPILGKIKEFIAQHRNKVRVVEIVAGQYLPEWRPGTDYRSSYSATRALGGGVDLDLSHELDYLIWIFGIPTERLFSYTDKISSLEIDSPDYYKGIFKYPGFVVDVELDYIRKKERSITIKGENEDLLFLDFIGKRCVIMDTEIADEELFQIDTTYKEELERFLGLKPAENLCTLDESLQIFGLLQ
jgi:predicted dehydrogenase